MNPSLAAQANQAAQQGQQQYNQDLATSNAAKGNYTNYSNQATDANNQLMAQNKYMQGAGSGQNVFNTAQQNQLGLAGYSAAKQNAATNSLYQLNGALNGANQQFSQAGNTGGFGAMSAGALGNYENSVLSGLNTGVQNANTMVGQGNTAFNNASNAAAAQTANQVQSEQNVVTGLTNAAQNYQKQAESALQNMQFFANLASSQGGLNAQEAQGYANAQLAYNQASQAIAQAKLIMSQTVGQNLANTKTQNEINAAAAAEQAKKAQQQQQQAVSNYKQAPAWYSPANIGNEIGNVVHGAAQAGGFGQDAHNYLMQHLFGR